MKSAGVEGGGYNPEQWENIESSFGSKVHISKVHPTVCTKNVLEEKFDNTINILKEDKEGQYRGRTVLSNSRKANLVAQQSNFCQLTKIFD